MFWLPDWEWNWNNEWWKKRFFYWLGVIILKFPRSMKRLGQYGEYQVILDTPGLWKEGHVGVPCAMVYENEWWGKKTPTIAVNSLAVKMWPEQVFEAILGHEAGHIEMGHLFRYRDRNDDSYTMVEEMEADRWATEKHGAQYVYAMEYLLQWHDSEELRERIVAVKRWSRYNSQGI